MVFMCLWFSSEWFFLLSHEMFNPYYGLFEYSARYIQCVCIKCINTNTCTCKY